MVLCFLPSFTYFSFREIAFVVFICCISVDWGWRAKKEMEGGGIFRQTIHMLLSHRYHMFKIYALLLKAAQWRFVGKAACLALLPFKAGQTNICTHTPTPVIILPPWHMMTQTLTQKCTQARLSFHFIIHSSLVFSQVLPEELACLSSPVSEAFADCLPAGVPGLR